METIALGSQGLRVSRQGLGCMGMSDFYGPGDDAESTATIHRALELGVTFFDTSDMYGPHTNEVLVGRALAGHRDEAVIATKFGIVRDPDDPSRRAVNGRPDYVRRSCDGSLLRLGVDHIDLYYQHRVDPDTPIEETVGAMGELVTEGKVRYLGLSEAAPATIRRAHVVHPISALQTEYSVWSRDPEEEILPTLRELGIGFVPYSPLGRGFLTGVAALPRRPGRGRLPPLPAPVPGRQPGGQRRHRRGSRPAGFGQGLHARADRPRLRARGRKGRRPDPGHQAPNLFGGERRRARRRADRGGPRRARHRRPGEGRPLRGHVPRQPVGHEPRGLISGICLRSARQRASKRRARPSALLGVAWVPATRHQACSSVVPTVGRRGRRQT